MNPTEKIAREPISRLSNERLVQVWNQTNHEQMTDKLARVRGWLDDELKRRMDELDAQRWRSPLGIKIGGISSYYRWLEADCQAGADYVSPARYLL